METKFNEQNDLLLIGLDSFYLSLIYAHVLTWQLDNTNAIYEIDEKYPRILFVPVIDKFLLVAEAYVANICKRYLIYQKSFFLIFSNKSI